MWHTLYPIEAAKAKNICCAGCSTQDEHVEAMPFKAGADLGDPSQQFLEVDARRVVC